MIRIGILQAGTPPPPLLTRFGPYPGMIESLLGGGYAYRTFDASRGDLPRRSGDCDAYVVTGSSADAFADAAWIVRLKAFLKTAAGRAPLVGICFGHQLMAEAFGGRAARAQQGWGIGLHSYIVRQHQPWMSAEQAFSLPASHRDQVTVMPPRATLIASSFFCPVAALSYDEFPALSFQAHPEFDAAFAHALLAEKQRFDHPAGAVAIAKDTLDYPADQQVIANWVRAFLTGAV